MKTDSTQKNMPFNPTPTLTLPLKGREIATFLPFQRGGREIAMFLPLQRGGQERDGVSAGIPPWRD